MSRPLSAMSTNEIKCTLSWARLMRTSPGRERREMESWIAQLEAEYLKRRNYPGTTSQTEI